MRKLIRLRRSTPDIDAELRADRPTPSPDFVQALAAHVRDDRKSPRRSRRVALSFAVGLLVVGSVASVGGVGYAAKGAAKRIQVVVGSISGERPIPAQQRSPANAQYQQKVPVCITTPSGRKTTIFVAQAAAADVVRKNPRATPGPCP